jgi:hypothetical protein
MARTMQATTDATNKKHPPTSLIALPSPIGGSIHAIFDGKG